MNVEKAGSIVRDMREALQDVVAPDLKSVVKGLADLKEEVRISNAELRKLIETSNALLREEMANVEIRTADRIGGVEKRTIKLLERVYDAVKITDLTRRNEELLRELEQARSQQIERQ